MVLFPINYDWEFVPQRLPLSGLIDIEFDLYNIWKASWWLVTKKPFVYKPWLNHKSDILDAKKCLLNLHCSTIQYLSSMVVNGWRFNNEMKIGPSNCIYNYCHKFIFNENFYYFVYNFNHGDHSECKVFYEMTAVPLRVDFFTIDMNSYELLFELGHYFASGYHWFFQQSTSSHARCTWGILRVRLSYNHQWKLCSIQVATITCYIKNYTMAWRGSTTTQGGLYYTYYCLHSAP